MTTALIYVDEGVCGPGYGQNNETGTNDNDDDDNKERYDDDIGEVTTRTIKTRSGILNKNNNSNNDYDDTEDDE